MILFTFPCQCLHLHKIQISEYKKLSIEIWTQPSSQKEILILQKLNSLAGILDSY